MSTEELQIENEDVYERIVGLTRSKLQNGIEGGFLTVNGKVIKKQLPHPSGRRSGVYELCQPGLHRIEARANGLGHCV